MLSAKSTGNLFICAEDSCSHLLLREDVHMCLQYGSYWQTIGIQKRDGESNKLNLAGRTHKSSNLLKEAKKGVKQPTTTLHPLWVMFASPAQLSTKDNCNCFSSTVSGLRPPFGLRCFRVTSQCSTTGVTKAVVCAILSVGWCI